MGPWKPHRRIPQDTTGWRRINRTGMTKYRKGPTKNHKGPQRSITQDHRGSAIPQRTAKEHYGLSCRKLVPIGELNGALYSSARQDFSHAAGLSWEPALSDSQSVRRGRLHHLWTWKFHSSSQSSEASALRRWLGGAVRAAAAARPARCVLTLCSRWHAKALLHGTLQSTSTDGSLTVLHRPESRCLEETGKSSSTKCRTYKTSSKNFD